MKLEVGKKYINGDKKVIKIIDSRPEDHDVYPFLGDDGLSYMADGRYYQGHPMRCWDIKGEVE